MYQRQRSAKLSAQRFFPLHERLHNGKNEKLSRSKCALRRQRKLPDATREDLNRIREDVEADESKLPVVERLYHASEEAGEHQMEDDAVFSLWKALIGRIRVGDPDSDLNQEKLNSLTHGEAHLLLQIGGGKRARYGIHPIIQDLATGGAGAYFSNQREAEIARSLRAKCLLDQRLPMAQIIVVVMVFLRCGSPRPPLAAPVSSDMGLP